MIIFAAVPPPQRLIQFEGTSNFVEIEDFVLQQPTSKVIDKICQDYMNKPQCNNAYQQQSDEVKDDKAQVNQGSISDDEQMFSDEASQNWSEMFVDGHDEVAPVSLPSVWEQRKKNAIKEAAARAEDESAKLFRQMRKDEQDEAKNTKAL
jgi:ribosome recycling factor